MTRAYTLDARPSPSPPPHSTPPVENLLQLVRQLRDGTYASSEDIVTTLTPDEYNAFETAINADTDLRGWAEDKLHSSWLPTTCQLIITIETAKHKGFSLKTWRLLWQSTESSVRQRPHGSPAHAELKRLDFDGGGAITPLFGARNGKLSPDMAVYKVSGDGNCGFPTCTGEVADTETWKHVQAKAAEYFKVYNNYIKTVGIFKIIPDRGQSQTSLEAKYQIWRATSSPGHPQASPEVIFRSSNGDVLDGALTLKLSDLYPNSQDDVDIEIPHHRLATALAEAEKLQELDNSISLQASDSNPTVPSPSTAEPPPSTPGPAQATEPALSPVPAHTSINISGRPADAPAPLFPADDRDLAQLWVKWQEMRGAGVNVTFEEFASIRGFSTRSTTPDSRSAQDPV